MQTLLYEGGPLPNTTLGAHGQTIQILVVVPFWFLVIAFVVLCWFKTLTNEVTFTMPYGITIKQFVVSTSMAFSSLLMGSKSTSKNADLQRVIRLDSSTRDHATIAAATRLY